MKQETIKIQVLNDTKLCVLPVLPDMKTIVPVESISNLTVRWGVRGHETEAVTTQIENGYIVLPISASMPLGVYSVHMQGTIDGEQWSDNRYEMFELTKYGEGIRYDRYYTKTVVVGLPDSYVQELREELERKIAEADAAYQAWMSKAQNIDGLAKQGNNPLATNTAIYDIVKQGGGGGITPEQYNALAKEQTVSTIKSEVHSTSVDVIGISRDLELLSENIDDNVAKQQTLNEIKAMLTLADGEVTAELQTL